MGRQRLRQSLSGEHSETPDRKESLLDRGFRPKRWMIKLPRKPDLRAPENQIMAVFSNI
jgi:hypothetical protein